MIVLTGGTGFLGSRLLRALLARGERVVVLKRTFSSLRHLEGLAGRFSFIDLDADPGAVERLFAGGGVDTVLHCATDYGRRARALRDVIDANILLPLRLLSLAQSSGVRRFVNTDTILDKRISHYSLSKSQFAQWLELASSSLLCVNVALEHFYGPGDDETKFTTHVLRTLLRGEPALPLTPGAQIRYFVHVDDVVDAFLAMLAAPPAGPGAVRFEVGSPDPVSIRSFVELAKRLTGNTATELRFGALPYREGEVMRPDIDLRPLESLGWRPRIPLEEGLRRTIIEERKLLHPCAG